MTCHHVAFPINDYDDMQYCPFEKGVTAVYSPGILDWEEKRMLQNAKTGKNRENIDTYEKSGFILDYRGVPRKEHTIHPVPPPQIRGRGRHPIRERTNCKSFL